MIAIKDMAEMPSSCYECALTYPRWDFNIGCKCCNAILGHHEKYGKYETERHQDCPLVEIVTCKDCKYSQGKYGYCFKLNTYIERSNFWCADAERRE